MADLPSISMSRMWALLEEELLVPLRLFSQAVGVQSHFPLQGMRLHLRLQYQFRPRREEFG